MFELTKKKFFEAAGINPTKGQANLLTESDPNYKPKQGFLLDKPKKRMTKKSDALKNIEKHVKKNARKMTMKEFFEIAGIDPTKGKAKSLVEGVGQLHPYVQQWCDRFDNFVSKVTGYQYEIKPENGFVMVIVYDGEGGKPETAHIPNDVFQQFTATHKKFSDDTLNEFSALFEKYKV